MTTEEEIARIKKDFAEHWPRVENHPSIKEAIASQDPVKLGEWVSKLVHGNKLAPGDINPLDMPPRKIVSVNKLDADWKDQVYVKFRSGYHVDLENFIHPDDEHMCKAFAQSLGATALKNPAKTKFFFRHSN